MLNPSTNFKSAIVLQNLKIAELYDVQLANGQIFYYTSHSQDIVWNAANDVYKAIPIQRNAIQNNINLEVDDVEIELQNITGDLFNILQNNTLNNAIITIKRIRWDQTYSADEELVYFKGTADVSFDRKILTLTCKSILDSLNIKVPRDLWQESCNKRLFDINCTLNQADYEYQGTVSSGNKISFVDSVRGAVYKGSFDDATNTLSIGDTITGSINAYTAQIIQIIYETTTSGSIWYVELSNSANFEDDEILSSAGNNITLNGVPFKDSSFYPQGEVIVLTGNNAGERRQIIKDVENQITFQWPFPNEFALGDTYSIYPGCDKTAENSCKNKFNNAKNFRGFIYVPQVEETL
jgi:hypothetical protein